MTISREKLILNGWARDKFQRDLLKNGIEEANDNDFIFISDVDEIPNLNNLNINKYENKIVIFNQKMIYYKLNLYFEDLVGLAQSLSEKIFPVS